MGDSSLESQVELTETPADGRCRANFEYFGK